MELMRFPLENTHSTRPAAGSEKEAVRRRKEEVEGGGGGGRRWRRRRVAFSNFLFSSRGMYLGGKSGTSQGVWSAAEMDHAILLVRCDAHEP